MKTAAYLRRAKWIIVALIVTNLLSGGIGIYSLRRTAAEYGRVFDQTVPALNQLNRLTKEASVVQRALGNVSVGATSEERETYTRRAQESETKAKEALAELIREQEDTVFETRSHQLESEFASYLEVTKQFKAYLAKGQTNEAIAFNRTTMRPQYEAFSEELMKAGDSMVLWGNQISDTLSDRTRSRENFLLTAMGWPVIAFIVLMISLAVTLGVLWFLALRLRIDEEP